RAFRHSVDSRPDRTAVRRLQTPPLCLLGGTEANMTWLFLIAGGLCEILWVIALKSSDGFTRLWPSVVAVSAMIVSLACLERGMRAIPVGTAYAVWTGTGAVGTALVGLVLLGESRDPLRLLCIFMTIAGLVGLKLVTL